MAKETLQKGGPLQRPRLAQLVHKIEDVLDELNWLHLAYKVLAYSYLAFVLWLLSFVLPFASNWTTSQQSDRVPIVYQELSNYFDGFRGFPECNIKIDDLYRLPSENQVNSIDHNPYCYNRKLLLEAMSNGGRVGFDAPYITRDCHYRWYSVSEICMILDRFDALAFIGDHSLQSIYNGLSILLRKDLANGALQWRSMQDDTLADCHCDNQFIKQTCSTYFVLSSDDEVRSSGTNRGGYACHRTPHGFLSVVESPAPADVTAKFKVMVPRVLKSNYKPVPVIHSLSPGTTSKEAAASSLLEFLALADGANRKTPMLWVGPSAAGHIEVKNRKGNQEIWDFDKHMEATARANEIDVLKMWNMTVQAQSWDGVRFGEKVAITQAMMIVNWLSRLESS